MSLNYKKYNNFLFDCDGVILDSNKIKTEVFYDLTLPYGKIYAEQFSIYHKQNGGISRFKKFEYFFNEILKKDDNGQSKELAQSFAKKTIEKLETCNINQGFYDFISMIEGDKYVVSGGAQDDLLTVFKNRKLNKFFKQICGSPKDKYQIVSGLNVNHSTSLFFGDSRLDYEVAQHFNMDFVFLYSLTEFKEWENFFKNKNVIVALDFKELLPPENK